MGAAGRQPAGALALGVRRLSPRPPGPSRPHPYLDAPLPLAISHRGFATDRLENTALAFQRAVDLGFRYLETDARATRDGVLLAFHDATLDRVTDRTGAVSRLPWREVRRARIGGSEEVLLLEDLLGAWPDARFNIDVKAADAVAPLVAVLRRTAALDRVCVASFSDHRLRRVRRALGPRLATSCGPLAVTARWAVARLGLPAPPRPGGLVAAQVPERLGPLRVVDERFVEAAHADGLHVHAWTVNGAADMDRLLDLGVDGIVTDRPDTLRAVLRDRHCWAG